MLVYGAPLLRNVTSSTEPLEIISADDIRKQLDLDSGPYLDFNLLLGTDFTQRIKNIGPNRALQFVKKYGCIENILKSEPRYQPRIPTGEYLQEVDAARTLFSTLPQKLGPGTTDKALYDDAAITDVLARYNIRRYQGTSPHWLATESALGEDYFHDSPAGP